MSWLDELERAADAWVLSGRSPDPADLYHAAEGCEAIFAFCDQRCFLKCYPIGCHVSGRLVEVPSDERNLLALGQLGVRLCTKHTVYASKVTCMIPSRSVTRCRQ